MKERGFALKTFLIILGLFLVMLVTALLIKNRDGAVNEDEEDFVETENVVETEDVVEEEVLETAEEKEGVVYTEDDFYLVGKAKDHLFSTMEVDASLIEVVSVEEVIFSDHSLGTSKPGEIYPQTPTPGYVVFLSAEETVYKYHLNDTNLFLISE